MATINTRLIEEYLEQNKLTKGEFCKKCEISYHTLRRLLAKKNDNMTILFKIARAMNINMQQLFIA